MANIRNKTVKLTTPWGRAGFCSLTRPNRKFKDDGEYSCRLVLPAGPETDALIQQLEGLYEEAYQDELNRQRVDKPKLEEIKRADKPFRRPVDPDTGETLPGWEIGARLRAIIRDKSKEIIRTNLPPVVVDAKNNPVRTEPGSGSEIRMQFTVRGFNAPVGVGLTLGLVGVQIRDFVPIGGAKAEFDDVDGFEVDSQANFQPNEKPEAPAVSDESGTTDGGSEW